MRTYLRTPLVALALAASACAPDEPGIDTSRNGSTQRPSAAAPESTPGTGGMQGMPATQSGETMEQMQAHIQAMHGVGGDSLIALLPMHRQMAANMVAEFNREMRGMNMAADESWNATVDSLRQDLVRMPEMSGTELSGFMPAHEARLTRLMEMHRSMVASMKM